MLLAQALGPLGQPAEAGRALARAESRHGLNPMLFAPELAPARAWTARTIGTRTPLRALHNAALLGDARAADDIGRWCDRSADTTFGRSALAHAATARGRILVIGHPERRP